jgi:hypothetical protein
VGPLTPFASGDGVMRILPRTTKGTWLLAAAAWVGLCAAAWEVSPLRPRLQWRLPEPGRPIGFGSPQLLVTAGGFTDSTLVHGVRYQHSGPFRLWDLTTGRQVGEFAGPSPPSEQCSVSRTGRWLVCLGSGSQFLLDTTDGHWLAAPDDPPHGPSEVIFEAADRWLLIRFGWHWKKYLLPDLTPAGETQDFGTSAVAIDGTVVAGINEDPNIVHLWDAVAGRPLPTVRFPADRTDLYLVLSHDGATLAVDAKQVPGDQYELGCWDVRTGRQLFVGPVMGIPSLGPGGITLAEIVPGVGSPTGRFRLTLRDLPAGTVRFDGDLPATVNFVDTPLLRSPDGRTLLFGAGHDPAARLRDLANWIGLSLPRDPGYRSGLELISAETGAPLGFVGGVHDNSCWSPDGSCLATTDPDDHNVVLVWDIPPRKPLTWFAVAAVILALPIAWLARWRVRILRREAA